MAKPNFNSLGKGGAMRGQTPSMRGGVGKGSSPKASTYRPLPGRTR
jgi:hypothetical protein